MYFCKNLIFDGLEVILRKKILFVLLVFLCYGALYAQDNDNRVANLQTYMSRFPHSQLRDVYKYCFQDCFGLEHLLSDSVAAVRYIDYEIANADSADWQYPLFYYPLLDSNYVRIDINYVRQGIIPKGVLVSAMLKSSVPVDYDADKWREQWHSILDILNEITPKPFNYDEDYRLIEQTIDSGKYALHHSRLFNATYRQHYRIVRRDVFEEILLPLVMIKK